MRRMGGSSLEMGRCSPCPGAIMYLQRRQVRLHESQDPRTHLADVSPTGASGSRVRSLASSRRRGPRNKLNR